MMRPDWVLASVGNDPYISMIASRRPNGSAPDPLEQVRPSMRAIIDLILIALNFYGWIIIIQAVLSWLIAFNVVNARNQVVYQIDTVFRALTEPVLGPIRKRMPNMGPVDLSPIVLLFGIIFVQLVLSYYVRPFVF